MLQLNKVRNRKCWAFALKILCEFQIKLAKTKAQISKTRALGGWMDGCVVGLVGGWVGGWMGGWVEKLG